KVLDFGLAKVLEAAQTRADRRVTDPGMVCGTPEYMAPEQARGENVDHRVDLYACGVLLYELLTGQLPFDGASPREIVLMHLTKLPPDIRRLVPERNVPQSLIDITYKAMAKSPKERFPNAREFAAQLKLALEPEKKPREREDTMQRCPSCGVMMPQAQKFCGECGQQLRGKSSDRRPAVAAKRPAKASLPLSLVGRDDEVAWLFERREALRGGAMAGATVKGPAGIGKTRLLREFLMRAQTRGDHVVSVGPDPWWAERGFYALRRAVVQLANLPEDGGGVNDWKGASAEARAGLERIFEHESAEARLPRTTWTSTPPEGPDGKTRMLTAEALRWALMRAHGTTEEGVVIVAIDDMHAIDGASRNAFHDVLAEPPLIEGLFLAAHAAHFEAGWEGAEELLLKGLPLALAGTLFEQTPLDAAISPASGARSETGARIAPMYVEQLMRYTREGGEDPPPKLVDLVATRIERLDADARRVLQAVAVLGDAARSAQLVALLPDMADIGRFMTVLRQAGFVEVNGPEARSSHPLVRDIVLASMPAAVRTELHARARRDFDVEDLRLPLEAHALHAYHAGQSFEALMLLEQTAERALSLRDDTDGAVRAFSLALDLSRREMMRGELEDPVGAVIMFSCKLGDALMLAGKHLDAEGVLTEALGLAGPQARERPRILVSLANVARAAGSPRAAYAHLDEALRLAEKSRQAELVDSLERIRQRWVAGV
ncbi:MAG TPA: AAA family ATPase, partial [Polyangiaceae bacterium]|nr:AAA family ATPase [Polyangiaceae bacterium]